MNYIQTLPPMQYRLYSIQQEIRWTNFAISVTPKADHALKQYRLKKRDQLRKQEADLLVQIAERAKLISLLVANEIEFIIIDEKINLL